MAEPVEQVAEEIVEDRRDDAAVRDPGPALMVLLEAEAAGDPLVGRLAAEVEARLIARSAAETVRLVRR